MNIVEIPVTQLELNSRNYRSQGDYYDADLHEQFERNGFKLFAPLIVTPDGDKFEIVSGNRSFFNLMLAAPDKPVTLPCIVREYASEAEHMLAIGLANELQLSMSPIDLAMWYQDLADAGLKQVDIATACNTTQPRVSKAQKLLLLPDALQDAIHHLAHAAHYSRQPVDQLTNAGVRYVVSEDGGVSIVGLTVSAANEILNLRPKKKAKAFDAFVQANVEEIIEISNTMKASTFAKAFRARAVEAGAIEVEKPVVEPQPEAEKQPEAEPPVVEATESASKPSVEAEATPAKGKAKKASAGAPDSSQGVPEDMLHLFDDPFAKIAVDDGGLAEQAAPVAPSVEVETAEKERSEDAEAAKAVSDALRNGGVSFVPEWNILLARYVEQSGVEVVETLLNLGVLKVTK